MSQVLSARAERPFGRHEAVAGPALTILPNHAAFLLFAWCATSCAPQPPLEVGVARSAAGCAFTIEGRRTEGGPDAGEAFAKALRPLGGRRAVLRVPLDTPYKCVGFAVFALQRAGLRVDLLTPDGGPMPF